VTAPPVCRSAPGHLIDTSAALATTSICFGSHVSVTDTLTLLIKGMSNGHSL